MADFYLDLEKVGSGVGTEGDPYSYADYLGLLPIGVPTEFGVRGVISTTSSPNNDVSAIVTWDKWGTDPWRMEYNGAVFLENNNYKNGILYLTGSHMGIRFPNGSNTFNMLIKCYDDDILHDGGTAKGCSFQADSVQMIGDVISTDCIFDSPAFLIGKSGSSVTDNCTFLNASPAGTNNNAQVGWAGSVWPAYDAAKESFDTAVLSAGTTTPPQPGNPPYTGYETGPWGNARTGIGGFYFPVSSYSVDFFAAANGSLTGDTTQTVAAGADASAVTAVPDTGYHFTAWSGDNTSSDNPLTLTNVAADMDSTANFDINAYSVNFTAGVGGSLTGDTDQTVNYSSSATAVTAVADPMYNFTAWSGDNTSSDNPLTVTNVTADMDMTANFFDPPEFNAVFIPGEGGSIIGETVQNVTTGQDTSAVTAAASEGYDFLNWTGGYEGTENPLTITVTSDSTTTANFVKSFARTKMLSAEYGNGVNIDELDLKDGKFSPARYLRRGAYPKSVNFPE